MNRMDSKVRKNFPMPFYSTLTSLFRLQAFLNPMAKKWSLESFTIGPMTDPRNRTFWHDAFHNFPTVPRSNEVAIILHYYPSNNSLDGNCWAYFDTLFSRRDIFPSSMEVDICATARPQSTFTPVPPKRQQRTFYQSLSLLRQRRRVTFWGTRE